MKEQPPALNRNLAPLDLNSFPLPPRGGAVAGPAEGPGHLFWWEGAVRHQHRAQRDGTALAQRWHGLGTGIACFSSSPVTKSGRTARGEWQEAQPTKKPPAHQDPEVRGPSLAPWFASRDFSFQTNRKSGAQQSPEAGNKLANIGRIWQLV